MTLRSTNFHQIFSSFIWQEDHHVLRNIKLPVALDLKAKVIFFGTKFVVFKKGKILTELLNYNIVTSSG